MGFFSSVTPADGEEVRFENDRFDDFLELFLQRLEAQNGADEGERAISLMVRSAESPAALALMRHADILRVANTKIRVIFGWLSGIEAISLWFDSRSKFHFHNPHEHIRWVKNACLLEAHEQLILGRSMCWSGDTMKHARSVRDSFELFEDDCPATARLGRLAFDALWAASVRIPDGKMKLFAKGLAAGEADSLDLEPPTEHDSFSLRSVAGTRH